MSRNIQFGRIRVEFTMRLMRVDDHSDMVDSYVRSEMASHDGKSPIESLRRSHKI